MCWVFVAESYSLAWAVYHLHISDLKVDLQVLLKWDVLRHDNISGAVRPGIWGMPYAEDCCVMGT